MDIRKFIREVLLEIRTGTEYERHFNDRVYDRFKSPYSTFSNESDAIKKELFSRIEYLKNVTFTGQDNIAVLLLKAPTHYIYHKPIGDKIEHGEGNSIWAIIRGDDLDTIFFSSQGKKPQNTQVFFTFEKLKSYIENEKGGNLVMSSKDLRKMQQNAPVEKKEPSETIININGVKWALNAAEEKIYKKNSPEKKYDVYEFLETQDEEVQDKILPFLIKEIFESLLI